jgi:hypothetical protein
MCAVTQNMNPRKTNTKSDNLSSDERSDKWKECLHRAYLSANNLYKDVWFLRSFFQWNNAKNLYTSEV